jgi:two-component system, chemotaxis family, CheB/CheR fusion protein
MADPFSGLLDRATRILAQSDSPTTSLNPLLAAVGERLNWDFGAFWRLDYQTLLLRCVEIWTRHPDELKKFVFISRIRTLEIDIGVPGISAGSRRPLWIEDFPSSPEIHFPRRSIAEEEGIHSGVAVPLLSGRTVLGVIEFMSKSARSEDPAVIAILLEIAKNMATYVDKLRLAELITGTDEEFFSIAQKTPDAILTIDVDSKIIYVNPAAERLFGYCPAQMEGMSLELLIPTRLRSAHREGMRRFLATGVRRISWDGIVLPALLSNGSEMDVEIRFAEMRRTGSRLFAGFIRESAATTQ